MLIMFYCKKIQDKNPSITSGKEITSIDKSIVVKLKELDLVEGKKVKLNPYKNMPAKTNIVYLPSYLKFLKITTISTLKILCSILSRIRK